VIAVKLNPDQNIAIPVILCLIVNAVILPLHTAPVPAERIAVLDFRSVLISEEMGLIVSEMLRARISENDKYEAVPKQAIDRVLRDNKIHPSDLVDTDIAVRIGRLTNSDVVISGSIVKTGSQFIFNARAVSVTNSWPIAVRVDTFQTETGLVDICDALVVSLDNREAWSENIRIDKIEAALKGSAGQVSEEKRNAFAGFIMNNQTDSVRVFLSGKIDPNIRIPLERREKPERIDETRYIDTPALILATEYGALGVMGALLNAGADVNVSYIYGITPLMVAAQNQDFDAIDLLIQNGADIHKQNENGDNALFRLLYSMEIDDILLSMDEETAEKIIRLFISSGIDLNVKNIQGKTAMDIAMEKNMKNVVNILSKYVP